MTGLIRCICKRLPSFSLGAFFFSVALASAQADTLSDIKSMGTLLVVTEMQYPPFDFMENGVYTGFNKDLLDEVGKEIGVKVQYRDLPWTSILSGLDAKKFDFVGAPINATKERMARYSFSSPFAFSGNSFIKKTGNTAIGKPEDFSGLRVGVMKASSVQKQALKFSETLPKPMDIREYTDINQIYADIANGRLDGGASTAPNVAYAAAKRPDILQVVDPAFGAPVYYGWITRSDKEDETLIAAVSSALAKIISDGRMATLQKKWFGRTETLPASVPEPLI